MVSQAVPIVLLVTWASVASTALAQPASRTIPRPLSTHPGNIFLEGEDVVVPLPTGRTTRWRVHDYAGLPLKEILPQDPKAILGRLPVGYYRIQSASNSNEWTSAGVLAQRSGPVPLNSPISLDVAMGWFYPKDKMPDVASLCALAGVNWVRDRSTWQDLEPQRGQFAGPTRYDDAAAVQSAAGLQVLQVNHSTPKWAGTNPKRFPPDLRDAFHFHRAMARRWAGRVQAFEPWNEADIEMFGGHTGAEMAALQKAAYLGLKAGNSNVIVCQNVFAKHRRAQLQDLDENEAWPYFDTFNLHHYEPLEAYPNLYFLHRDVAGGKPLWVSEAALPVKWSGSEKLKEPTEAEQRRQAENLVKTYVTSLWEGSANTFYFMLPHYVEGQTQFGLLRPDLTPRPAYLALAATARLFADVEPVGRESTMIRRHYNQAAFWDPSNLVESHLFKSKARKCLVRVAWAKTPEEVLMTWGMGSNSTLHTHLGLERDWLYWIRVGSAPVIGVFPENAPELLSDASFFSIDRNLPYGRDSGSERSAVALPPRPGAQPVSPSRSAPLQPHPARTRLAVCPIVLQPSLPEARLVLERSAHRLRTDQIETVMVYAYNFSDEPLLAEIRAIGPAPWGITQDVALHLPPGARRELTVAIDARQPTGAITERVRVEAKVPGRFTSVLSMRFIPENHAAHAAAPSRFISIQSAQWQPRASGGGEARVQVNEGRIDVEGRPRGEDKWVYPALKLAGGERPTNGIEGLALSLARHEGEGQFRVVFEEANGAHYVSDIRIGAVRGETTEAFASFEDAVFGQGWSPRDANGKLDPAEIRWITVGCNTKSEQVKYSFSNLRWVIR